MYWATLKDLIRNSDEVLDAFTRKDAIDQEGKLRTEQISQVKCHEILGIKGYCNFAHLTMKEGSFSHVSNFFNIHSHSRSFHNVK